jgi:folate-binding protein YgfZ
MQKQFHGVAPLTDLGLIRVQGADAAKFLHGQLTTDFTLLGLSEARLAGYCNAKGRLLASFIGFKRSPDDILLICSKDILATTLRRLGMFVMRAKLSLSDASAQFALYGLAGSACDVAINNIATKARPIWSKADFGKATMINLYPADGVARALWVAPVVDPAPSGQTLSAELWAWSEVRSGIATITQALVEVLVPQMLNYESVGGVNFKKGCYPGQEVVARSQFRGTLKRRAYLAHANADIQAGTELFSPLDADQPCGCVVQSAAAPGGGFAAIVSMQISAYEAAGVHALTPDGPLLTLSAAPYPLLADL